jgi:hypothetical protein
MKKRSSGQRSSQSRVNSKDKSRSPKNAARLQIEYQQRFHPYTLPYQGLYSDHDSLEQPSALKYVPTTATPNTEA